MSPDERARLDLAALAAEVRDDLEAIDRLAGRVAAVRVQAIAGAPPDPNLVMAAAGFLHHVYTAMESILERIAATVDGAVPAGDRWHNELLTRMGVELPGIRPAVLSQATRAQLARLLRFRHFFRHAYRIDLLWVELAPLAADLDAVVAGHRSDLESFCAYLASAVG